MSADRGKWLATAVALGISADGLLRVNPWGLNVLVWAACVLAAGVLLRRRSVACRPQPSPSPWLLGAALLLTAMVAWRAEPLLIGADLIGAVVLLAVAARRARTAALPAPARDASLVAAFVDTIGDFRIAARSAKRWALIRRSDATRTRRRAVLTGVVLSAPALGLFGGLFASADPVFDHIIRRAIRVEWPSVVSHVLWVSSFAWVAGAYLVGVARGPARPETTGGRFSLGAMEVSVLLGSVAALFLVFVGTQASALFGGEAFVQRTAGLTFATYARGGFYQLTAAVALSLPLVVFAGRVLRVDRPGDRRRYQMLAFLQLGLLAPVLGSAVWRMALYIQAYGMSIDRLYAIVCLAWLAWMAALVGWGLGRGHAGRALLTNGGLAGTFLSIVLLHAVNPAALVIGWNLERAAVGAGETGAFDADYAASLGPDAVPALVAAMAELAPEHRCLVADRLRRARPYWDGRWRTFAIGRARAEAAIGGLDAHPAWYANCSTHTDVKETVGAGRSD